VGAEGLEPPERSGPLGCGLKLLQKTPLARSLCGRGGARTPDLTDVNQDDLGSNLPPHGPLFQPSVHPPVKPAVRPSVPCFSAPELVNVHCIYVLF
jgi:hypothetical protein